MYKNNSKGKPYYTQRNNKIKPGSSCNVTSMVAALSAAGWPVEKMASGGRQPEDELMRFILTDAACDRKWRMLDPQGRIPPNEWHAVLAYGTNRCFWDWDILLALWSGGRTPLWRKSISKWTREALLW